MMSQDGKEIGLVRRDFVSFGLPEADDVEDDFRGTLENFLSRLEKASDVLEDMRQIGSSCDLYVVFFGNGNENVGETFSASVLNRLSQLKADLVLAFAGQQQG